MQISNSFDGSGAKSFQSTTFVTCRAPSLRALVTITSALPLPLSTLTTAGEPMIVTSHALPGFVSVTV